MFEIIQFIGVIQTGMPAIVTLLVKSSLILIACGLSTHILRTQATWRYRLWLTAFTAILLLPVGHHILPALSFRLQRTVMMPGLTTQPSSVNEDVVRNDADSVPWDQVIQAPQPAATGIREHKPVVAPIGPTLSNAEKMTLLVSIIWLSGVLILGLRFVLGQLIIRRIIRNAKQSDTKRLHQLMQQVHQQLRVRQPVHVLISDAIRQPMTIGIFRPRLIFPRAVHDWSASQLRCVLLHELAHVKRRDTLVQSLLYVLNIVYWPNPLMWWAFRRMLRDREQACDAFVLKSGTRPSEYASLLLEMTAHIKQFSWYSIATVPFAKRNQFERRILALFQRHSSANYISRTVLVLVSALLFISLGTIMALTPYAGEPEKQPVVNNSSETTVVETDLALATPLSDDSNANADVPPLIKQSTATKTIIEKLAVSLDDSSESVRREAVETLGKIDDPAVIPLLKKASSDPVAGVRAHAIDGLSDHGVGEAVDIFINALNDENATVRWEAIDALEDTRQVQAAPQLSASLQDASAKNRKKAAVALSVLHNTTVVPALINAIDDKSRDVKRAVIYALGKIGDVRAVPALSNMLSSPKQRLREQAVEALGRIDHSLAFEGLKLALNDRSDKVREKAIAAIGRQQHVDAIGLLGQALRDKDSDVREVAARALLHRNNDAAEAVIRDAFQAGPNSVKRSIIESAEDEPTAHAISLLELALHDPDAEIRCKVVSSLADVNHPRAVELLSDALADPNENVRKEALKSIGELYDKK